MNATVEPVAAEKTIPMLTRLVAPREIDSILSLYQYGSDDCKVLNKANKKPFVTRFQ